MKKAAYVESQNAISHLMPIETLHSVHSVVTSIEERHFDVRHICVKIGDCWFIQQLNRCFSDACYVPDSGLGSEDGAGSWQQ